MSFSALTLLVGNGILHWSRVTEQIAFRLVVLVYRCLHGTAPAYLSADLLRVSDVGSQQRLRSATTSVLVGTQRSTIGDRAFAAATPAIGNSLPEEVQSSTSLQLFGRRLTSELFRCSLHPRYSTWLNCNVTMQLFVTIFRSEAQSCRQKIVKKSNTTTATFILWWKCCGSLEGDRTSLLLLILMASSLQSK